MQVNIHYHRIGKAPALYRETLVEDSALRLLTETVLDEAASLEWCRRAWWPHGFIPAGVLVHTVRKRHFYREWFSIMELRDRAGGLLGYYCDINRPLEKAGGDYRLLDLMLDVWVAADGSWLELDRDEFQAAVAAGLIAGADQAGAEQALAKIVALLHLGCFPGAYL